MTKELYIVTGANSGLGFSLVSHLVGLGKSVVGIDRSTSNLLGLIETVVCDFSQDNFLDFVPEHLIVNYEKVILINNAGLCNSGKFFSSNFELVENMLRVNLIAPLKLAHHLKQYGNLDYVVNVLSSADLYPLPDFASYGASKRALRYWTETVSLESNDIKFLAVVPGAMKTNLQANNSSSSKLFIMNPHDVACKILDLLGANAEGQVYLGIRSRISLGISKIPLRKLRNFIVVKLF